MKSSFRRKSSASSRTRPSSLSSPNALVAAGLGSLLIPLLAPSAYATSQTWDGDAGDNLLGTTSNWSANTTVPGTGETATWDGRQAGNLVLDWNLGMGGAGAGVAFSVAGTNTGNLTIRTASAAAASNLDLLQLGGVSIASGAGAFTLGDGTGNDNVVFRNPNDAFNTLSNDSTSTATLASNVNLNSGGGGGRAILFTGSGNWKVDAALKPAGSGLFAIVKEGSGKLTITSANNNQLNTGSVTVAGGTRAGTYNAYTINAGTLEVAGAGLLGGANNGNTLSANITNNGTLAYNSTAAQTLSGVVSGTGSLVQGSGNLTLSGANTYTGATTINGGTLTVGGAGAINASSGIVINGASAKYVHTSSVASTRAITLTNGTVDGTGTLSAVTVGNGTGGVIANGNGGSSALTLGSLAFQGAGSFSIREDGNISTAGLVVTGALSTTPANGQVTVNASQLSWNNGVTYSLVSFGSFSGSLSDFSKGLISGLTSRQSASLVLGSSSLGLSVVGDTPKWTGADSGAWVAGSTGANGNWRLITAGTATDYIAGDVVLFDDSATTTAITLSTAHVSPSVVNFANSAKDYTLGGDFGIASGTLNKSGSGTVTISTANTYAGGTNISEGTLALAASGTLGATTGALSLSGGALDLGGTSQTVGATTLGGAATIGNGTLSVASLSASNAAGNALVSANLTGSGGVSKSGAGTLTLSGNNSFTGATVINGGTLALAGSGSLGATSSVTLGGGSLDLGGSSQSTSAVTISAPTTGATISNGTLSPASLTVSATSGTVGISANLAGATGLTVSGGGTTVALSGNNTFTGNVTLAANSAITVTGGSNTGGGALAYNSFGTTFTMSGGSYVASGVTSSGNSDFRFLNLNGGTFRSNGNLFASGAAIATVFNGGTFRVGNASGVTLFDANNTVEVLVGGATIDTSLGNLSIGTNASSANPVAIAVSGGALTIAGGNALVSRITGNGAISITDGSTWNLNGAVNNAAASLALADDSTFKVGLSGVSVNNTTGLITLTGLFSETLDGGSYSFDFGGFDFTTAGSYKLIGYASVSGSFSAGDFLAANASFGPGLAGGFVVGANDLSFVVSAIPEPSSWSALAGLAALASAATRRRRTR